MSKYFVSFLLLILTGVAAAAQESYRIKPGDVLTIEVLEDASLNRNALVLPDGTVSVPLVGSVAAAGNTLSAVQAAVTAGLAPNFAAQPTVFVTVGSIAQPAAGTGTGTGRRQIDVFAMGEVNNPGTIQVPSGTNLLQFLAASGGLTKFAATKRIQLRRTDKKTGQQSVYTFNYHAIENGTAPVNAIVLRDGDVIVVPQRRLFE